MPTQVKGRAPRTASDRRRSKSPRHQTPTTIESEPPSSPTDSLEDDDSTTDPQDTPKIVDISKGDDSHNDDSEEEYTDNPDDPDEYLSDSNTEPNKKQETGMGSVRFKDSYKEAVSQPADPSKAVTYMQRRLAIMIHIPEVDNNVDRLHHIVLEINEFVKAARHRNPKFRLRKFDDITTPSLSERTKWRTRLNQDSSSDFQEYVQGYYPFTPPRGGAYRFRINTVMDDKIPLSTFLEDVTHHWGQKDTRSISDIKAQKIWDPVKIGYLMRAPRFITHSYDLITALENTANRSSATKVFFGVSWSTIPSPVGGYDKSTAVQAVMLETNRHTVDAAIQLLRKWYPLDPKKQASPPFEGNFRFVMNRDNPRIKGNPMALANLSILMERQGIFNKDTKGEQTFCIKNLDTPYKGGSSITMQKKLLQTTIQTLGDDLKGSPLFLSVSNSINNRTGNVSVWFTFHKRAAPEAISVVRNLPSFIATEWEINPEYLCYAHFLNPSDTWDAKNRVANNEDTEDIRMAAEIYSEDLRILGEQAAKAPPPNEEDANSMTSKAEREMSRMLNNDDETIKTLTQAKKISACPTSIAVQDDNSQGGISGVSGASSKSSMVRAQMRKEFEQKFDAQEKVVAQLKEDREIQRQKQDALSAQIVQLQAMLASLHQNTPRKDSSRNDPDTPTVPLPPRSSGVDEEDMNPDFDPTVPDKDFKCLVAEFEERIIQRLDHTPTDKECVDIRIEAEKLASASLGHLASSSSDSSEKLHTPKRFDRRTLALQDSDESEEAHRKKSRHSKRLAYTVFDDATDTEFEASSSSSPKKKAHVTGDAKPGVKT